MWLKELSYLIGWVELKTRGLDHTSTFSRLDSMWSQVQMKTATIMSQQIGMDAKSSTAVLLGRCRPPQPTSAPCLGLQPAAPPAALGRAPQSHDRSHSPEPCGLSARLNQGCSSMIAASAQCRRVSRRSSAN